MLLPRRHQEESLLHMRKVNMSSKLGMKKNGEVKQRKKKVGQSTWKFAMEVAP